MIESISTVVQLIESNAVQWAVACIVVSFCATLCQKILDTFNQTGARFFVVGVGFVTGLYHAADLAPYVQSTYELSKIAPSVSPVAVDFIRKLARVATVVEWTVGLVYMFQEARFLGIATLLVASVSGYFMWILPEVALYGVLFSGISVAFIEGSDRGF